jgi:hypothetical protein
MPTEPTQAERMFSGVSVKDDPELKVRGRAQIARDMVAATEIGFEGERAAFVAAGPRSTRSRGSWSH